MEMPKLTDAHRKLEMLVGEWFGDENMHPSQWTPEGAVHQAKLVNRMALDGFAVVGDYEQSKDGAVCFRGHSVFMFEPQSGEYHLHWFDTMGANVFRGKLEGNRLVMNEKGNWGYHRMTYEFPAPGKLASKMEMSQDGQNWKTMFDGTYTRK